MSSPITELTAENKKLKEEIEKLKANDEEAMKLSMRQNELFMNQLEEKDEEIDKLKHFLKKRKWLIDELCEPKENLYSECHKLKNDLKILIRGEADECDIRSLVGLLY